MREHFSAVRLLVENSPQFLNQVLNLISFEVISNKYKVNIQREKTNSPMLLLSALALQLGFTTKGETPDAHKAGEWLMNRIL